MNELPPYQPAIPGEVHVLLVEHDGDSRVSMADMLQMCSYRVTMVELASTALVMLGNGGEHFDIVMANIHSPDYQGFRLLETAVNRNIMTILISVNEDVVLARRALECGAFLYIKKPVSIELVKYLWQHVLKERLKNGGESTIGEETDAQERLTDTEEDTNRAIKENNQREDDGKTPGKRKATENGPDTDDLNNSEPGHVKRKICTEWTQELHAKFMDAVTQLGDGKCYPKDILERMNVPGLTRMQVASHLQKCRNENWRAPAKRKIIKPQGHTPPKDVLRRFGSMPPSCMSHQPGQPKNRQMAPNLELNSGSGSKAPANGRGGSSSLSPLSNGGNSTMQNGGAEPPSSDIFCGIGAEKSNGGNTIPACFAFDVNSEQFPEQNLSTFFSPAGAMTNSQAYYSPIRRQIADDFFEFPDMEYISENISNMQQQGSGPDHAQSSQQAYSFDFFPEQVPLATSMEERCQEYGSVAAASNANCM